jgi:hypothetical protein
VALAIGRQALRVLASPKMPPADRAAIAAFAACTLRAVLGQDPHPQDGLRALGALLAPDATTDAPPTAGGAQSASLQLPAEGAALASLWGALQQPAGGDGAGRAAARQLPCGRPAAGGELVLQAQCLQPAQVEAAVAAALARGGPGDWEQLRQVLLCSSRRDAQAACRQLLRAGQAVPPSTTSEGGGQQQQQQQQHLAGVLYSALTAHCLHLGGLAGEEGDALAALHLCVRWPPPRLLLLPTGPPGGAAAGSGGQGAQLLLSHPVWRGLVLEAAGGVARGERGPVVVGLCACLADVADDADVALLVTFQALHRLCLLPMGGGPGGAGVLGGGGGRGEGPDWAATAAALRHPTLQARFLGDAGAPGNSGGAGCSIHTLGLVCAALAAVAEVASASPAPPAAASAGAAGVAAACAPYMEAAIQKLAGCCSPQGEASAPLAALACLQLAPFMPQAAARALVALLLPGVQAGGGGGAWQLDLLAAAAGPAGLAAARGAAPCGSASGAGSGDGDADAGGEDGGQPGGLLGALRGLCIRGAAPSVDACLAAALARGGLPPAWSEDEQLLGSCLDAPSAPRAAIAAALVGASPPLRAAFGRALPGALARAEQGSGTAPGGRRGALALLLPAALACLRACPGVLALALPQQQAADAAAAGGQDPGEAHDADMVAAGEDADMAAAAVVQAYRDPLLAYMQRKRRRKAAPSPGPGGPGSADLPPPALEALHGHALPMLALCLRLRPLEAGSRQQLLAQCLPAAGWAVDADEARQPLASAAEQVEFAAWLVRGHGGGRAAGEQLPELAAFVGCSCATLAAQAARQARAGAKGAPPSGRGQQLAERLWGHLDGWVGDALAGLADELRESEAFARVCTSIASLAAALLQHSSSCPAAARRLRRLLAALLPGGVAEGGDGGQGGDAGEACEQLDGEDADEASPGVLHSDSLEGGSDSGPGDSAASGSTGTDPEADPSSSSGGGGGTGVNNSGGGGARASSSSGDGSGQCSAGSSETSSTATSSDGGGGDPAALDEAGGAAAGAGQAPQRVACAAALQLAHAALQQLLAAPALVHAMAPPPLQQQQHPAAPAPPEGQLPSAVAELAMPLPSLMPLADALGLAAPPQQAPAPQPRPLGPAQQAPGSQRQELATLAEVLLDMCAAFSADVSADEGGGALLPAQLPLRSLWVLLLGAYGGTLAAADRALLRVLHRVEAALEQEAGWAGAAGQGAGGWGADAGAAALAGQRCGGLWAAEGRLWGPAAQQLHATGHGRQGHHPSAAGSSSPSTSSTSTSSGSEGAEAAHTPQAPAQLRRKLLADSFPLDPRRCALTCLLWPEARTLAAEEEELQQDPGGSCPAAACQAAYDPAALLPLALVCVRDGVVPARQVAASGLLAVCCRALASADRGLRWGGGRRGGNRGAGVADGGRARFLEGEGGAGQGPGGVA